LSRQKEVVKSMERKSERSKPLKYEEFDKFVRNLDGDEAVFKVGWSFKSYLSLRDFFT